MTEVVIVEAVRSAVGKRNGALAHTYPADIDIDPDLVRAVSRWPTPTRPTSTSTPI